MQEEINAQKKRIRLSLIACRETSHWLQVDLPRSSIKQMAR